MEPRNRFQRMNSASLRSLAGRYDNPIPTRFLAPMDCLKIPAQYSRSWTPGLRATWKLSFQIKQVEILLQFPEIKVLRTPRAIYMKQRGFIAALHAFMCTRIRAGYTIQLCSGYKSFAHFQKSVFAFFKHIAIWNPDIFLLGFRILIFSDILQK